MSKKPARAPAPKPTEKADAPPQRGTKMPAAKKEAPAPAVSKGSAVRSSSLLDTRVVYCGDNLEQLAKLPDKCVDLIYIDPPFKSNRNDGIVRGESPPTKEKRSFDDRHASHPVKVMLDHAGNK